MDQPLKELTTKVDNLVTFVQENVVTKQELQDMKSELPSKAEFAQLHTSVDGIARHLKGDHQPRGVTVERPTRMGSWIMKALKKIGFDHRL